MKIPQNQMVTLSNGREVINLCPTDDRQLAVVDINVIKRLAALLPTVDIHTIRENFVKTIRETYSIEEFVSVLKDEVSFHESVNLIQQVDIQPEFAVDGLNNLS